MIELKHGTCACQALKIVDESFNAHSCLTSCAELAEYYADCAVDECKTCESGDIDIVIVRVDKAQLSVDYPAFEEPISIYRNNYTKCDKEWEEMIESRDIPYPKDEHDIDVALEVTTSVKTTSHINRENVCVE